MQMNKSLHHVFGFSCSKPEQSAKNLLMSNQFNETKGVLVTFKCILQITATAQIDTDNVRCVQDFLFIISRGGNRKKEEEEKQEGESPGIIY